MMPQQLGVGVKYAAELMSMGLRITLSLHAGYIIIIIDLKNAFDEIKRALTTPRLGYT